MTFMDSDLFFTKEYRCLLSPVHSAYILGKTGGKCGSPSLISHTAPHPKELIHPPAGVGIRRILTKECLGATETSSWMDK